MLDKEITEYFESRISPSLIITVGNTFRSDDGAGPYIASRIDNPPPGVYILDAGENPENIIDDAVGLFPARAVIIDAADFGGCPGEARFIPDRFIPQNTLSTHSFPLPVITSILRKDTGCEVRFLGIQAKSFAMGEGLCSEVTGTAEEIVSLIMKMK